MVKGGKSKSRLAKEWWDKIVHRLWLPSLTHGELKFTNVLYVYGNFEDLTCRPGARLIERETGLHHDYHPIVAYRLFMYGILTGRYEYMYGRKNCPGYLINPEPPSADPKRVAEIRREIKAQMIPFKLGAKCAPSVAQLCALWPLTVRPVVLNPVITSFRELKELPIPMELKQKDLNTKEKAVFKEHLKNGYDTPHSLDLILKGRRVSVENHDR